MPKREHKTSELPWTKIDDYKLIVAAATPVEDGIKGAIGFALPDGGKASIPPKGQKLPVTAGGKDE